MQLCLTEFYILYYIYIINEYLIYTQRDEFVQIAINTFTTLKCFVYYENYYDEILDRQNKTKQNNIHSFRSDTKIVTSIGRLDVIIY
jgi:hypothetical protein